MRMVGKVKTPPECRYAPRCTCYIPRTQFGRNGKRLAKRSAKMKERARLRAELIVL